MDPAFATLVLASVRRVLDAASDEAGKQAWQGLVALVRRARRQPDAAVERADPERVARTLVEAAGRDPGFAEDLRRWVEEHSAVVSVIAGTARDVVQARDISGGVHFHAPAGISAVPQQVPLLSSVFTGRVQDRAALDGFWRRASARDRGAVVVVHGPAGVGKTSLAIAWLDARRGDFPDGRLYADLRGYSGEPAAPGELLGGFLRSVGVAPQAVPDAVAERAALWRTLTAGLRLAVLVDNAVTAAQVRALAPTGPGCVTVAVSREGLGGLAIEGAWFHRVEPWRAETGVALLERVLGRERVAAEREAALRVAQLCGGLPLAVGVAAARLAARPSWPIARLEAALRQDARRLEELSVGADAAVGAALDGSFALLEEPARYVYCLLGTWPLVEAEPELVGRATGWSAVRAEQVLEALVDASMLREVAPGRYQLHDLVRLHAAARAAAFRPEGWGRELLRLCDALIAAATAVEEMVTPSHRVLPREYAEGGPGGGAWLFAGEAEGLEWLEERLAGYMSVLRFAAGAGLDAVVWQIADALWPVFLRRYYRVEQIEAQRLALAAAGRLGRVEVEGMFLTSLAGTLLDGEDVDGSLEYGHRAVALYERSGDVRGLAQACNGLGKAQLERGDAQAAEALFCRALRLREQIGYRRGVLLSHQGLGRAALAAGDALGAAGHLEQAYRGLLAEGDGYDAAWSLAWWAQALAASGRSVQARELWGRAESDLEAAGSRIGVLTVWEYRGRDLFDGGERAAGRELLQRAAEGFEQLGRPAGRRIRRLLDAPEPGGRAG